jgi:hypothetical protein
MKTTEIFIEQVIIGFVVLLIAAVPFHAEIRSQLGDQEKAWEAILAIAAAMVGAAYLLGILFDRFADSVLDDLSQRQLEGFVAKEPEHWKPPFPEARLRIAVLRAGGSSVEWLDYLRSRLRLSRAMAVFMPGLNFAIALALRPQLSRGWFVAIPIAYAALLLLPSGRRPNSDKSPPLAYDLLRYPGLAILLAFGALALTWVAPSAPSEPMLGGDRLTDFAFNVAVIGVILTALSGWTWWRINSTYLRYLENFSRFGDPHPVDS